jgi:ribonuclease E
MKKEMLINVLQPEECRIAIVEDGVLEELYVERTSHESYVGNIYKGRIVNIEPSIQAAFVDFGVGRNGFLHVSDVEPTYYRHLEPRFREGDNRRGHGGRDSHRGGRRPPSRAPEEDAPPSELPAADLGSEAEDAGAEEAQRAPRSRSGGKRPRRGRGKGGPREKGSTQRDSAREDHPNEDWSDAPGGESSPPDVADDRPDSNPPPRLMDSAERRTEEEENGPGFSESAPTISDEELFFPRESSDTRTETPQPAPSAQETEAPDTWDEPEPFAEPAPDSYEPEAFEDDEGDTDDEGFSDDRPPSRERDRSERPRRGRNGFSGGPRRRSGPGRASFGRPKPLIQDIFRRGQEVLVQVIKEGIGTKGPTLSTYISIAGRYLVLMPGLNRIGVSRKIADDEQRRRLREVLHELQPPKGLGFIIRTAGLDKNKKELQRDLAYLSRLWQVVVRRIRKMKGPAEIYEESDMITRTIRDTFTSEIDSILVDEPAAFEHAQEFLQIVMPRYASRIQSYNEAEPLFHRYGIEEEIARIQQRHVPLINGGSIVIEQTEALVAIDVNSGNFRADNNAEETAYQMNLQAAKEIARQLRLRDLGGVIVNDFIDMRDEKHRRGVERALRDAIKRDRARTKILRISAFGLIEMTRQRIRPSLKRSVYQDCAHCGGTGQVKTCESMSIDVMRMLQLAAHRQGISRVQVSVAEEVAHYLLNKKRKEIGRLEAGGEISVSVNGKPGAPPEMLEFACYDNNNNEIKFFSTEDRASPRR